MNQQIKKIDWTNNLFDQVYGEDGKMMWGRLQQKGGDVNLFYEDCVQIDRMRLDRFTALLFTKDITPKVSDQPLSEGDYEWLTDWVVEKNMCEATYFELPELGKLAKFDGIVKCKQVCNEKGEFYYILHFRDDVKETIWGLNNLLNLVDDPEEYKDWVLKIFRRFYKQN